jgi:tetratricopeptide (TPR) repeat protein
VLFGQKPYDRSTTLQAAEKARARGKKSKAIAEYRKVLAHDPHDAVVHGKIAPLLAQTEQLDEAWTSFVQAAQGQIHKGFVDRAIALYQQAALFFPQSVDVWETIARLHQEQGRRADCVKVLMDGQKHFVAERRDWPVAMNLLRRVLAMEPMHVQATLVLARLLKKTGERAEALRLVETLLPRVGGKAKRALLKARFGLKPSLRGLWHWLRA